jgi:hypothetical protein
VIAGNGPHFEEIWNVRGRADEGSYTQDYSIALRTIRIGRHRN